MFKCELDCLPLPPLTTRSQPVEEDRYQGVEIQTAVREGGASTFRRSSLTASGDSSCGTPCSSAELVLLLCVSSTCVTALILLFHDSLSELLNGQKRECGISQFQYLCCVFESRLNSSGPDQAFWATGL